MNKFNKKDLYVILSFVMFIVFMIWYFLICDKHSMAPSDFAIVTIGVLCSIECIVMAWLHTRPTNSKGLSNDEEKLIGFVADCVGKILNIESPTMRSAESGYSAEDSIESEDDCETNNTNESSNNDLSEDIMED